MVVADLASIYGATPALLDTWPDWKRIVWGLLARPDRSVFAHHHRQKHST